MATPIKRLSNGSISIRFEYTNFIEELLKRKINSGEYHRAGTGIPVLFKYIIQTKKHLMTLNVGLFLTISGSFTVLSWNYILGHEK